MFMQRAKGNRRQKGRSQDVSIPKTFKEFIAPTLREKMHIEEKKLLRYFLNV